MTLGVWEKEVRAFETKNGVTLPPDFREYLTCIGNGAVSQNWGASGDGDLYAFWALDEIESLTEEHARSVPESENPSSYFIFADWCIWCWAYAIRLGPAEPGKIIVVGGDPSGDPLVVANSFTDFIEAYIQNPSRGILEPLTSATPSPRAQGL